MTNPTDPHHVTADARDAETRRGNPVYSHIEQWCQLHERIEITYVVDGYEVELYTERYITPIATGKGSSIESALKALDLNLANPNYRP